MSHTKLPRHVEAFTLQLLVSQQLLTNVFHYSSIPLPRSTYTTPLKNTLRQHVSKYHPSMAAAAAAVNQMYQVQLPGGAQVATAGPLLQGLAKIWAQSCLIPPPSYFCQYVLRSRNLMPTF